MSGNSQDNGKKIHEAEIVGQENQKQQEWQRQRYAGQPIYGGVWSFSPMERQGCLGPAITFALFLICVGQFGVLAGIGFAVFYCIGAILGSMHFAKMLMEGRHANPWAWRAGNWTISLLLTIWLAGGFEN